MGLWVVYHNILYTHTPSGLSAYTSPLCRSYSCKVLAHFPQKQLPWNPFDESAIRTVSTKTFFLYLETPPSSPHITFLSSAFSLTLSLILYTLTVSYTTEMEYKCHCALGIHLYNIVVPQPVAKLANGQNLFHLGY